MDFAEIKERLSDLYVASICDANKEIRALDSGIRPIQDDGVLMVGIARTVRCKNDFLTVLKALADAEEDEVLVVDGQDGHLALAGGLFSSEANRKGLTGLVIDGAVRDTEAIRSLDMPVYARRVHPVSGTANKLFETQVSVTVGGVEVKPGDIIFGDDDGIIVSTLEELSRLIPIAEEIQKNEAKIETRMNRGDSLLTMLNFTEHCENVVLNKESKLAFKI